MRKLIVFNSVTLDGYFAGPNGDISWAHAGRADAEWDAFIADNAKGGGQLLFGRVTYDLMARYWPTAQAMQNDPVVAERMNSLPKVVFSRTMKEAAWSNTKLVKTGLVDEIRRLKAQPGPGMAMFGSGGIVAQLAPERLIDEFQLVVTPIVLGQGRTMFDGLAKAMPLKLVRTRVFTNGKVLMCYEPVA